MKSNTAVRVFLASQMDIIEERQIFKDTIQKVNSFIGKGPDIYFEVVGWEDDVLPNAGIDAQDVVNNQIKQVYDIFVGLFKSRIGTKTHRSISGTVEEYKLAQLRRKSNPDLRIMCYFFEADKNEAEGIQDLKAKMNNDGILYVENLIQQVFTETLFKHFSQMILQYAKTYREIKRERNKPEIDQSVAVAIVIDEKVLLVKRSLSSTVGSGMWQIPGGKVDAGESPLNAAEREICEELGLYLDEVAFIHVSTIKTKNLKNNNMMNLFLYMYRANDTLLSDIALNSENEEWEMLPLSSIISDSKVYLGYNKQLITILWRELFITAPLETLLEYIRTFPDRKLPSTIGNHSSLTSTMIYAFLSMAGLVHFSPEPVMASSYSERIIEELVSLSRNNIPLFENTNFDSLRDLNLSDDEFPSLQMHREKLFFSHKSLMSVLSCKAPLKNGRRNVADVIIFGRV